MSLKEFRSQSEFPLLSVVEGRRGVGVRLTNTGKRFNREWIFRHCNYEFISGKSYAITGPNGSGKSTLLLVIAGAILHNEGSITYTNGEEITNEGSCFRYISIAAPYLELIEEMTAKEMLKFHTQFKPLITTVSIDEIIAIAGLENAMHKQIRYFSSGMKQRLKLAQAFFSDTPFLLLDEPVTNLDADGIAWYHQLINDHSKDKLVIISSNDAQEYHFCEEVIEMGKYK